MAKSKRGRFITLEGGEGAGKSTNARYIRDWLAQHGRKVVLTREPGGAPLAEAIRELVLRNWDGGIAPDTELLLMFAARSSHLHSLILPALAAATDVVCDRFIDSTYAYQGAGKGLAPAQIRSLERLVLGTFKPDLTIVFDLPVAEGLRRAQARGVQNRFEAEPAAYMRRVRASFLARARAAPRRYAIIDAAQPLEHVQSRLRELLEQRL